MDPLSLLRGVFDTAEDAALLQALNEAIDEISPDLKVTDIVDRTPPGIYSGEASTWSRAQLAHPRGGVRR